MRSFSDIGISSPDILLPNKSIDLKKWSVVACDQFTSEPEYWQQVENIVGQQPSTYHLILPEAYLGTQKENQHQRLIPNRMREYVENNVFSSIGGFIFVERFFDGIKRQGLICALDLECYDFHKESQSLIRATEGTILDRIPPRVKIRQDALIEVPHILVLIDDPECSVIEPMQNQVEFLPQLYDFDLMLGGGSIKGFQIKSEQIYSQIIGALRNLASPEIQNQKYGSSVNNHPLLFAIGDGNHSLATAKTYWDNLRSTASPDHPARHAIVELLNIHDPGIIFEPIHRLVLNSQIDIFEAIFDFFPSKIKVQDLESFETMATAIMDKNDGEAQVVGFFSDGRYQLINFLEPQHTLSVGNVQLFLDELIISGSVEIDYIHGQESIFNLGNQPHNTGIYLPAMNKTDLFKSVAKDGPLPRKTFSMGEAHQKRYYLECRLIQE